MEYFLLFIFIFSGVKGCERDRKIREAFACYDKCDKELYAPCWEHPSEKCVKEYSNCVDNCKEIK